MSFKLFGSADPVVTSLGDMTQGIGHDLVPVDSASPSGQQDVVEINVLSAASYVDQEPVGTDAPLQLTLGPAQTTPHFDLDAAGAITVLQAGPYSFRIRMQFGRTSNPSVAIMFARLLINGVQAGDSAYSSSSNSSDSEPATFSGDIELDVGDIVSLEIVRDSQGENSGGLYAQTPTLGDWADAPSVIVNVTQVVTVPDP